jgi:hypothetical protein
LESPQPTRSLPRVQKEHAIAENRRAARPTFYDLPPA